MILTCRSSSLLLYFSRAGVHATIKAVNCWGSAVLLDKGNPQFSWYLNLKFFSFEMHLIKTPNCLHSFVVS